MSEWTVNFCRNIRYLRQVHTMTQREMAQILGISVSTYGKLERCEESVRIHCAMLCRVCDHFQVSGDDILMQDWHKMREEKHRLSVDENRCSV